MQGLKCRKSLCADALQFEMLKFLHMQDRLTCSIILVFEKAITSKKCMNYVQWNIIFLHF